MASAIEYGLVAALCVTAIIGAVGVLKEDSPSNEPTEKTYDIETLCDALEAAAKSPKDVGNTTVVIYDPIEGSRCDAILPQPSGPSGVQ